MEEINCIVFRKLKNDEDITDREKRKYMFCETLDAYKCNKIECAYHKDN